MEKKFNPSRRKDSGDTEEEWWAKEKAYYEQEVTSWKQAFIKEEEAKEKEVSRIAKMGFLSSIIFTVVGLVIGFFVGRA